MKSKKIISISIIGILFIACCCISCKKRESERLEILIQNETDSIIHVKLFPKKIMTSNIYPMCEGCGGIETEFNLHAPNDRLNDNKRTLFLSSDLSVKPYTLATIAFDSIHISLTNKDNVIIKFTHDNITGYSENIFTENSTWDFKIIEGNEQTMFKKNPVRFYQYSFLILKDKIIINNNKDE